MCGIAFIINYDKQRKICIEDFEKLFSGLSVRGTDASGYYFERGITEKRIFKAPVSSKLLLDRIKREKENGKWGKFKITGSENLIMMHCRMKTHGSEYNNLNNMPIFSKQYLLVHNGVMRNERLKDYKYKAEVDSEEILAQIEGKGIVEGLKSCVGTLAVAIRELDTDFLFLYRNSNPLELFYDAEINVLFGCSKIDYVPIHYHDPEVELANHMKSMVTLPLNTLWKINIKKFGIENLGKIDAKTYDYKTTTKEDSYGD